MHVNEWFVCFIAFLDYLTQPSKQRTHQGGNTGIDHGFFIMQPDFGDKLVICASLFNAPLKENK